MKTKIIAYLLITSILTLYSNLPAVSDTNKLNGKINYTYKKYTDDNLKYIDKTNLPQKVTYSELKLEDYPIIRHERNKNSSKIVHTGKYYYKNAKSLRVRPVHRIKTKNKSVKIANGNKTKRESIVYPLIGTELEFETLDDIIIKNKIVVPKGNIIKGVVSEVSSKAMGGAPAEIRIGKFKALNFDGKPIKIVGDIEDSGLSLSLWVGLVELGTTPFLFGLAAPLLRFVPGGQANISTKEEFVLYYYES